jgi:regulator of sigma E protease
LDQPNHPDRPDHVTPDTASTSTGRIPQEPAASPDPQRNGTPAPAPAPAPPLTPLGWLMSNGPYLLLMIALAVWIYRTQGGFEGLKQLTLVILGLGFVVFIHELGHFLAAKWCDVHVQTFSIGFGPALPGCSFTRGETTYKIGVLPLGGYVNMVGENPEADEDEDYPRSFKNKTVGQRMIIISAGVVMNLLFGALCFIGVYRFHGMESPPAEVWRIESGSRAWQAGVRPGWKIVSITEPARWWSLGGKPTVIKDPDWDDFKIAVALSAAGRPLTMTFRDRDGKEETLQIEPLRDENNLMPVIGVSPPSQTKLIGGVYRKQTAMPVLYSSPAARARVLDFRRGDKLLAVKWGDKTEVPLSTSGWKGLCGQMTEAKVAPMTVTVERGGKKVKLDVPAEGFSWDDRIIGTTDPATPDEPFNVSPLPPDPSHPDKPAPDPYALRDRMRKLKGKPMVFQVRRHKSDSSESGETASGETVNILVPPAYRRTLGLRMKMGKVAAIREGSKAAETNLSKGDLITAVTLTYGDNYKAVLDETAMDPIRLPYELARRIEDDPKRPDVKKWRVTLEVRGLNEKEENAKKPPIKELPWDDSWHLTGEGPGPSPASPMSIPQLGIAYYVDSKVMAVVKGSPAEEKGIKPGDDIRQIQYREATRAVDDPEKWNSWADMYSERPGGRQYDQWAFFDWLLQRIDFPTVKMKVSRDGKEELVEIGPMDAQPDPTWPVTSRGLRLSPEVRLQKADTIQQAVVFGLNSTTRMIKNIYVQISSMLSGRISTKSLGGPVEIASQAFNFAGQGFAPFALFLGIISINLAVVNFLPIPVLDGGHMVFLFYEKLRGRRPSERVQEIATYLGLLLIVLLMLLVLYQDLKRRGVLPHWM